MVGYGIGASLVHETGHQVAALLDLVASLRPVLYAAERRRGNRAERFAYACWGRWISEIVADFWAVSRLGVAGTIGLMGVVGLPRRLVLTPVPGDPHPFPYIRVMLSCALGDALYPHPQWKQLAGLWAACYPVARAPREVRGLVSALEATAHGFLDLLLRHRPPALGGEPLARLVPRIHRTPERLLAEYERWALHPAAARAASPTLAFAVLGQARAVSRISPEDESRLLGDLITHWALSSTLDSLTSCAGTRGPAAGSS
ncbi:hypothetical protein [Streptomyces sp. NPDC001070]